MTDQVKQTVDGLQERQNASPVLPASSCAKADGGKSPKPIHQSRGEKTPKGARVSGGHSVFVLSKEGKALTPTTPSKARKLLRDGVAVKKWSKFGTFGIQLTTDSRKYTPATALGVDNGTKFEGYSVVVGEENPLNVKLDLPDKKAIVRKMDDRRCLRRFRRYRNCRRRPARFSNRSKKGFIAPSQLVIVNSRLKVIREFFRIYPINIIAFEDVRFNYAKHKWGSNFSTIEIGKTKIKDYFISKGAKVFEYQGFETQENRKKYGYAKTSSKRVDKFSAHCSDSLTLAVDVITGERIEPGRFLVVDDTYRYYRRRLHDTQPTKGGIRNKFARGTVFGLRKGLLVGNCFCNFGQLCGEKKGNYRYYTPIGKRRVASKITWVSSNFCTRHSP